MLIGSAIDGLPEDVQALVRQKTESAILRWNNANTKLEQAAFALQKKTADAAGQINTIVENISDKIISTNKIAEAAQTALRTDASLSLDKRKEEYTNLFRAVLDSAEQTSVLNEVTFGGFDQLVKLSDAAKQIPGLAAQIENLNFSRSNMLSGFKDATSAISSVAETLKLSGLNIPAPIAKTLDDGIKYAQVAQSIVANVATGNYIGAVLSVTGMMGGGPSQEQANHQEIMQGIRQILRTNVSSFKELISCLKDKGRLLNC